MRNHIFHHTATNKILEECKDSVLNVMPVSYTHLDVYKRQRLDDLFKNCMQHRPGCRWPDSDPSRAVVWRPLVYDIKCTRIYVWFSITVTGQFHYSGIFTVVKGGSYL